jgi:hypothetical protein
MVRKATVAGSVQGPAVMSPASVAGSQQASGTPEGGTAPEGEKAPEGDPAPEGDKAPEVTPQPVVVAEPFPREIVIVNDTQMNHIVAATLIGPGAQVPIVVRSEDEITRMKTDISHLMELTPAFMELEVQPLRVVDAAAE